MTAPFDWPPPQACMAYPSSASPTGGGAQNVLVFDCVVSEQWDEPATVTEHSVEVGANVADHVKVELVKCTLKVFSTNEPLVMSSNSGQGVDTPTVATVQLNAPTSQVVPLTATSLSYETWDNPILARELVETAGGLAGGLVGGALGGSTGTAVGGAVGLAATDALAMLLFPAKAVPTTTPVQMGLNQPQPTPQSAQLITWPSGSTGRDYVAEMHQALEDAKNSAQTFDVFGSKNSLGPMVIESLAFSRDASTGSGETVTIGLKELRVVTTQTATVPIPNLSAGGGTSAANHGAQSPTTPSAAAQVSALKAAGAAAAAAYAAFKSAVGFGP